VNNLTDYVKKLNNNSALKNLLRDKDRNKFVNTKIIIAKIVKNIWIENKETSQVFKTREIYSIFQINLTSHRFTQDKRTKFLFRVPEPYFHLISLDKTMVRLCGW
jgi:hypothetical protein